MSNFLRWLTLTSMFLVAIGVAEMNYAFFSGMASIDTTYICYVIWSLFGFGVVWTCFQSLNDKPHLERVIFLAEISTTLGLLGSFIGLGMSFLNLNISEVDFGDKSQILNMMEVVTNGLGISLTTTITGIIASILLSLYVFVIKDYGSNNA